jgi:hypothetical protein
MIAPAAACVAICPTIIAVITICCASSLTSSLMSAPMLEKATNACDGSEKIVVNNSTGLLKSSNAATTLAVSTISFSKLVVSSSTGNSVGLGVGVTGFLFQELLLVQV